MIGTGLHAIGGISASSCYLPFSKTKRWSWESFWLIQAFFAWLIMPLIIGLLTVPQLFEVLKNSPREAIIIPFLLGAVYGFGGMSFGYAIRQIGFSLTYTISIGLSAVLGTITPLILNGTLVEHFQKPGGEIVLGGMLLSIVGVALCGSAGYKKERDLKGQEGTGPIRFDMKKGLTLTIIAGLLSAVFGISLDYGQPVSDVAAQYGAGHFEGNAKIIISTAGCFVTNFIWFVIVGIRRGSIKEIFHPSIHLKEIFRAELCTFCPGWFPVVFPVLLLRAGSCAHGKLYVCQLGHSHVHADFLQLYYWCNHERVEAGKKADLPQVVSRPGCFDPVFCDYDLWIYAVR